MSCEKLPLMHEHESNCSKSKCKQCKTMVINQARVIHQTRVLAINDEKITRKRGETDRENEAKTKRNNRENEAKMTEKTRRK